MAAKEPWVLVSGGFHEDGGMDRANAALADFLLSEGRSVHLVTHRADPRFEAQGASVTIVARPAGSYYLGAWALRRTAQSIAAAVTHVHPSARVVTNGGNCGWPDVNWVHCLHHSWPRFDDGAPAWFRLKNRVAKQTARWSERRSIQSAALVIANSDWTAACIRRHLRVDPARVQTVYLGCADQDQPVTPDERRQVRGMLGVPDDRPVVAFVGAIGWDDNKGLGVLLRAWERLSRMSTWDATLLVLGSGLAVPRWRSFLESTGLHRRVHLLGHRQDVNRVLAAVDLLVSPVRYEAYGLNVQEAVSRGIPAVVSRSAGIAERYPARLSFALLQDPTSIDELVETLRRWRESISTWRAAFTDFSLQVRRHSWRDMARTIVEAADRTPRLRAGAR